MSDFATISDLMHKDDEEKKDNEPVDLDDPQVKLMKKMGQVSLKEKEEEAKRFAASIRYPHINLEKFPIGHNALKVVSREKVDELQAGCFFSTPDEFRIGALDPTDQGVQDLLYELEERHQAHGALYVISEQSLERIIAQYNRLPNIKPVTKDLTIREDALKQVQADVTDFRGLQDLLKRKTISDVMTFVLGAGLKLDASDVHIEAEEDGIHIRFRLDGVLQNAADLPREDYKRLISRIKLISSLKINITDKPQDGRFTIKLSGGDVDVRVSTIPTIYGESVVMRLLRQDREQITLEQLGFRGRAFDILQREIQRPNGMIITTGPTGSGKTTTLYAVMAILNKPGVKILTLEDPVEYKMEGINQSQVDLSKDYTFAKGLRSMLRQDPDIAMVGEIRDLETADIAVQAALTGHLMLSTIHTNSAAGTIPRFLSMGVKPFLLAPALNVVMAQRLVRRLCDHCKQPARFDAKTQAEVEKLLGALPEQEKQEITGKAHSFFAPNGCEQCNGLGYKGRIGIYEIFVIDKTVEKMILDGQFSEYDIQNAAVKAGMVMMVQDGLLKAMDGLTSVEEVFRVIE